jgi:ribonuclease D
VTAPLITDQDEVLDWCADARDSGRLGIDTEFLWERTYSPKLCLVQIAVEDDVAIIDPLVDGVDLQPVADLIADPDVETILHAPHADLVAFAAKYDCAPANVFDTQIAAGFVGLGAGLSYERLVAEALDRELAPSESFTDWSKRPLADKQLIYAAEDVEHLFDLADELHARLQATGREDWARQELSQRFERMERLITDPDSAYRKVARRNRVNGRQLGALRALAAWRELTARKRDLPTSWVMKDATLVELARRNPKSAASLKKVRGAESLHERDVNAVLEALEDGTSSRPPQNGDSKPPPPRHVRERVLCSKGVASSLLRARCEAQGIASELVATTSELEALIAHVAAGGETDGDDVPSLLQGWRGEMAGHQLVDLIEGRIALRLTDRAPYLELGDVEID